METAEVEEEAAVVVAAAVVDSAATDEVSTTAVLEVGIAQVVLLEWAVGLAETVELCAWYGRVVLVWALTVARVVLLWARAGQLVTVAAHCQMVTVEDVVDVKVVVPVTPLWAATRDRPAASRVKMLENCILFQVFEASSR